MKTRHQIVFTEAYIAHAQRRSIAQNAVMKFFYQTWWAWWVPRVFIVGLIIFLLLNHLETVAALLGVFLAISFWGEWLGRRNLAKVHRNARALGTTTVVAISEPGIDIDIDGALANSHLKWAAVFKPAIYPDGVLIKVSRLTGLWLPDQALVEGSPSDIRKLLSDNVSELASNR